jgi:50S ribosomal protein L16 3-hydroxylase
MSTHRTPLPTDQPMSLLAGLSPQQFMKRHWQKRPLLIRQAIPGFVPPVDRQALFALATQPDVESRLIAQRAAQGGHAGAWQLKHGPFQPRQLPPQKRPGWTLLVQGVDLHVPTVHALMQQFRFVPDARLDDIMISWASEQGGVGPHVDSYDVFLLQAHGRRRWRIAPPGDRSLVPNLPVKILAQFAPTEEFVLEPGDMLYLPPNWGHDGVADSGDCMTYSIGFRVPQRGGLAGELVQRMAENMEDETLYRDPQQTATDTPAQLPDGLLAFAQNAVQRLLADRDSLQAALGEVMTEPKPTVWFAATGDGSDLRQGVVLDARSRMLYDARHIYINGESFRAAGADARLMQRLANQRQLSAKDLARASEGALELLAEWCSAGWLHAIAA